MIQLLDWFRSIFAGYELQWVRRGGWTLIHVHVCHQCRYYWQFFCSKESALCTSAGNGGTTKITTVMKGDEPGHFCWVKAAKELQWSGLFFIRILIGIFIKSSFSLVWRSVMSYSHVTLYHTKPRGASSPVLPFSFSARLKLYFIKTEKETLGTTIRHAQGA